MKLPSMRYLIDNAVKTFFRFPYPLCVAAGACALFWWLMGQVSDEIPWVKLLLTLALGVPLLFSLLLMRERPPFAKRIPSLVFGPLGFLLMGLLLIALDQRSAPNPSIFYFHWLLPTLVLVSFAPYFGYGEINGFWHFNQRLATRVLVSGFYTVVFFAGVSVVLAALDKLLGVDIAEKAYARLWFFAALVFFPWHLLAGVPRDFSELERDDSYPNALKVFTQYLLVPLATVYFVILYVYLGKILFTQQWPSGWVAMLTASASVLGLVTFLLLFPVRNREGNAWIARYSKGFCISALPLLGMLFVSVYKRTDQYGLTERRYLLIVLAFWLLAMFVYFIFSKAPDIRWVPASFCILAALTSFGPWGAYEISFRSQTQRLKGVLERNGMLVAGKAVKAAKEVSLEDRRQVSACLSYVGEYHGLQRLQPLFREDLKLAADKFGEDGGGITVATKKVMGPLGLDYVPPDTYAEGGRRRFRYIVKDRAPLDVEGYAAVYSFRSSGSDSRLCPASGYRLTFVSGISTALRLCRDGVGQPGPPLTDMLKRLEEKYPAGGTYTDVPQDLMTAEGNGMKVCFQELWGGPKDEEENDLAPVNGTGILFLKKVQ